MKRIIYFSSILLSVCCLTASAQNSYQSAIGVRAGIPIAASFKHFVSDPGAIEVDAGFWHDPVSYGFTYFTLGAMYQYHFPITGVQGLRWYVGGGVVAQFFHYNSDWGANKPASTAFGINAVGGIDYKFSDLPLNLSADWTPTVFLAKAYYDSFRPGYFGVCARYTFR